VTAAHSSLDGAVALVTGGSGALGTALARALGSAGAVVAILARDPERLGSTVELVAAAGGEAMALTADVLDRPQLERARDAVLAQHGRIDVLVNAAGGNVPEATVGEGASFFDLPLDALRRVVELNLFGTVLPCQVFGEAMIPGAGGDPATRSIVNVSSMASQRALTRVAGYGAAKAAVESFTRWLAVDCARRFGDRLRVNAIAPGFFVGEQNRALLLNPDDTLTARGQKIIDHTPFGRFGEPDDLVGTLLWLCSPAARFVTGTVTMVDGGANAFSGI
jgi:NAD(P)-dependent dehydrogenase (short-subunit alcohol dehydrogenase family)